MTTTGNKKNDEERVVEAEAPKPRTSDRVSRTGGYRPAASVLTTVAAVLVAGLLGWAMWGIYMGSPWTRDATVRAYVVTIAPEVAGRIVELPIGDNKFVKRGDSLMVIDPTNYSIAVSRAEAAVRQAQANIASIEAQIAVQQAQISASKAQKTREEAALVFAQQQSTRYASLANEGTGTVQNAQQYLSQLRQQEAAVQSAVDTLNQAQRQLETLNAQQLGAEANLAQVKAQLQQTQVDLARTRIVSPVDGYVTNLLVQRGDYANAGINAISVVDVNSFWIDGYFEETIIAPIREGDPARIKLMGHPQVLRGHVDSIARAISVSNAQPNMQGIANVNPIFTWVRLAQRIPVRIHIDDVPADLVLAAGMTATVEIDKRAKASSQ